MAICNLPRALCGVRGRMPLAVDFTKALEREAVGGDERARLPRGVDRAEEEHLVADDASAGLDADIAFLLLDGVDHAVVCLHGLVRALERARPAVAEDRSAEHVRAALRHDVDDAAERLAKLGFVAACLDLHFLDEVERGGRAEG